jgi:hypothetical protein
VSTLRKEREIYLPKYMVSDIIGSVPIPNANINNALFKIEPVATEVAIAI